MEWAIPKGVDRYGTGGHVPPNIWTGRNTITSVSPNIWGIKSSQVVFVCWFRGILFHQSAYFTLMLTKKLHLQLLGDFVPQTPTMALPLDTAGGHPSLDPLLCSANRGERSTPLALTNSLWIGFCLTGPISLCLDSFLCALCVSLYIARMCSIVTWWGGPGGIEAYP